MTPTKTLRRVEIRDLLRSRKGSMARIAEELEVTHTTVSLVLKGTAKSARVMEACERKALEILAELDGLGDAA